MSPLEDDPWDGYMAYFGDLEVKQNRADMVEVYFVPSRESLKEAIAFPRFDSESDDVNEYKVKLLDIDGENKHLNIYPINTFRDNPEFLKSKYKKVKKITLAGTDMVFTIFPGDNLPNTKEGIIDILLNLHPCFVSHYGYGLGLRKPYRFIIEAVESLSDCTCIIITKNRETEKDAEEEIFYISNSDFESLRLELNKIERHTQNASRTVRETVAYNMLAIKIGMKQKDIKIGRHDYRKRLTAAAQGREELSSTDQNILINLLTEHATDIAKRQPKKVAKLRGDIELATLESLIQKYEEMLKRRLSETDWQNFFNENPFILSMAFGYPVIKVQDQASMGGRKISGDGEKITDFLIKNSLTNNTAICEIKKPGTKILNVKQFRENVYTPSSMLSGSINQALDQKYQFQQNIAQFKQNTRLYDIESYAVHCCLVIGMMPDDNDKRKSFELFRGNSKEVEIVTFDEILQKIKNLKEFLHDNE